MTKKKRKQTCIRKRKVLTGHVAVCLLISPFLHCNNSNF